MAHDGRAVANCILDLADAHGLALSNMSLLKVLYYAHGWHWVRFGSPLVSNHFEAWEFGPVVRSVYNEFKSFDRRGITSRAKTHHPTTLDLVEVTHSFSSDVMEFLAEMVSFYGRISAFELSKMTHEPGSPWHQTYEKSKTDVVIGTRIPAQLIRDHFLEHTRTPLS